MGLAPTKLLKFTRQRGAWLVARQCLQPDQVLMRFVGLRQNKPVPATRYPQQPAGDGVGPPVRLDQPFTPSCLGWQGAGCQVSTPGPPSWAPLLGLLLLPRPEPAQGDTRRAGLTANGPERSGPHGGQGTTLDQVRSLWWGRIWCRVTSCPLLVATPQCWEGSGRGGGAGISAPQFSRPQGFKYR